MISHAPQPAVPREVIRAELARVVESSEFVASRHLTNFLQFVVEEALAGREDRLKERTIALGALGRETDFDPRMDCIVRVVAGKLRRALERYYATRGASDPLCIGVPAGSYVPVFREAASQAPPDAAGPAAPHARGSRIRSNSVGCPIMMVLPFRSFTTGAEERLVADLLAEDVAVQLSRRSWLEVLDDLATRSPGLERQDPPAVAERRAAEFVLAGTVGRIGEWVRITVRLIDVRSGVLAWAGQFESRLHRERLSWHDDTVNQIVARVGDIYGVLAAAAGAHAGQRRCGDVAAFDAVLSSFQYQCRLDRATFPQVLRAVERAVMKNPEFAWGWAALGSLHLCLMCCIAAGGAPDEPEQALAPIKRALTIDPTCSYAHFLLGLHHLVSQRADEAVECAGRALQLALGSPFEIGAAGALLSLAGEHQRGKRLIRQALHRNPRLPGWIHWGSAIGAFGDGDHEDAVAAIGRFTLPDCFWDPLLRAAILGESGDHAAARASLERACRLQPELTRRPREFVAMFIAQPHARERVYGSLRDLGLHIDLAGNPASSGARSNGRR